MKKRINTIKYTKHTNKVTIQISDNVKYNALIEGLSQLVTYLEIELVDISKNVNVVEQQSTDTQQHYEAHIMTIAKNWYKKPLCKSDSMIKRYPELKAEGIIPMRYIQNRTGKMSLHQLKRTIDLLVQHGFLIRVDKETRKQLHKKYKWTNVYHVELFTISDINN